jgi:hypothetical protein
MGNVVVSGTAITLAAGAGTAIAAAVMTRKLKGGQVNTAATGVGWGSLSEVAGHH